MTNITHTREGDTTDAKKEAFAPPVMTEVALFPVEKPNKGYIVRRNGNLTVTITPSTPDNWVYGKTARLLLLYIKARISSKIASPDVDRENRTVLFQGSFRSFCKKLGVPYGGKTKTELGRTLLSLASTTVKITRVVADKDGGHHVEESMSTIAERGETGFTNDPDTVARIKFTEAFWTEMQRSTVPLDADVIARLGRSARALDVYLWLSKRTYSINSDISVSWEQLYEQFEATGMPLRNFKTKFRDALARVLRECPEMSVDAERERIVVHPSKKKKKKGSDTSGSPVDSADTPTSDVIDAQVVSVSDVDVPVHVHSAGCSHVRAVGESVFGDVLFESGGAAVFDGLCGRLAGLWNEAGDGADAVALAEEVLANFEG